MWAPKLSAALAVTAMLVGSCPTTSAADAAAPVVVRQDAGPPPAGGPPAGGPPGGGPPGGGAGGGPPSREPASDQCLTPEEYGGTTPSELPGYRSCFRYVRNADGTATVSMANVPNHPITSDNPNSLCYVAKTFTLPVPVKGEVNRQVPPLGPMGVAVNGVYLFGPGEGDGGNAVSGIGERGIMVDCTGTVGLLDQR